MKINTCSEVGGVLVLGGQTVLHTGQMDQIQHLLPVKVFGILVPGEFGDRLLDGIRHGLHLFDPVLDELALKVQGGEQMTVIDLRDRHIPDILQ